MPCAFIQPQKKNRIRLHSNDSLRRSINIAKKSLACSEKKNPLQMQEKCDSIKTTFLSKARSATATCEYYTSLLNGQVKRAAWKNIASQSIARRREKNWLDLLWMKQQLARCARCKRSHLNAILYVSSFVLLIFHAFNAPRRQLSVGKCNICKSLHAISIMPEH